MTDADKVFAGSIPEFYDTYLVPLIFSAYAADLAQRVVALNPQAVLEIAAGSGVVTRAMAPLLAADAAYTVTDLNQPMLDHAAAKQPADGRITWRQADALHLPFDDHAFDVVMCQFGVMFFPDRVAGHTEARRVLRPGGHYLFSVWDHIAANEFADLVTETAVNMFPDDPPRFLQRTPHGYHDVTLIRAELAAAGFTNVAIDTVRETSAAPSPRHPAVAYCEGTPLRNEIEAREPGGLQRATVVATEAIRARYGPGPVEGRISAVIVSAG